MSLKQLQADISAWGRETFGRPDVSPPADRIAARMNVEVAELINGLSGRCETAPGSLDRAQLDVELGLECADVAIMLVQVADALGVDLEAYVIMKMKTNRAREWGRTSTGKVQHVSADFSQPANYPNCRCVLPEIDPTREAKPAVIAEVIEMTGVTTAEQAKRIAASVERKMRPKVAAPAPAPVSSPAPVVETPPAMAEEPRGPHPDAFQDTDSGLELLTTRWYVMNGEGGMIGPAGGFADAGYALRWAQGPDGRRAGIDDVELPEYDEEHHHWKGDLGDFNVLNGADLKDRGMYYAAVATV